MSNRLIHFLFALRNCPMLVALLLGLTALLGVAPPAVAQTSPSLTTLELVAIYTVAPPDTPRVGYDTFKFKPLELLADTTTSQSVTITTPNWEDLNPWHFFCSNKDVRSLIPQDDNLPCRQLKFLPLVTLNQKEINNGGVVWHVVDGGGKSIVAKWIPIPDLEQVMLNPDFSPDSLTYTGKIREIPATANSLRIIPTASSGTIDVRVNSGSDTRVASGNPHVVSSLPSGVNTVTVSVTDGGNTTSYTVTLSPNAVPSFGMATVAPKTFTSGYPIDPFQVPAASGGDEPLTYSVIESETDSLPAGLTFDVDGTKGCGTARQICGTPTAGGSSNVTIEAKDLDGDPASLSFSINIVGVSIYKIMDVSISDTTLTESNLNGAKITLRLQNTKFESQVDTSHFELDTEIQNVSFQLSETPVPGRGDVAVLILSFSGDSNFTTDQTLAVTVRDSGHQQSHDLTTAPIEVFASRPSNVRVTALVDTLEVGWTAVTNATGYKVQWKSGTQGYDSATRQATTTAMTTTYKIPGLTAGTTYTVRVIARINATDSDPSVEVTGVPKFTRPGKPSNVQVKPWVVAIIVSWDTAPDAEGYKVQWKWKSGSQDSSASLQYPKTTMTMTDTIPDLKAGTTYTVRVIATRTNADSSASDPVKGMPVSLDIDGDGRVELFEDIIIIIRYVLSVRGASLISGSIAEGATRTTHQEIDAYLQSLYPALDIDGDGRVELFEDVIIIIRYVLSVRGASLISGSIAEGATRTTHQEITAYLQSLDPSSSPRQGSSTGDDVSIGDILSSKAAISMDAAETTYTLRALAADGDPTSLLFALGVLLPTSDFDGDGQVTFADFLTFAGKFGTRRGEERYDARCDLNGDGEIGFDDFLIFADSFDSAN